ncbi:hypothetical protein ACCC92_11285 [Mucilaginibacter sp. Mucisp84]|uniref:hypothetical protein n=1 Tax=Mucilaginibacter sp. Mucisp84 TaxID=3243058 RepID=UPI0039A63403
MKPAIRTILNTQFEITQNKLLLWRNRYKPGEYPGKVALNLHYAKAKGGAYLPLVAASFGLNHFLANGQQEYLNLKQLFANSALHHGTFEEDALYPIAYNVTRTFEQKAEQKVIPILEASIAQLLQAGNPPVVAIQTLVNKAGAGDKGSLTQLERAYTAEVMAFETFLAWASWGLMNIEAGPAMEKTIGQGHILPLVINEYCVVNQFLQQAFINAYLDRYLVALPPL